MPATIFDPPSANPRIRHQPRLVMQIGFEQGVLRIEPYFGRVELTSLAGLSFFEMTERGERQQCLMLFFRGQPRPGLAKIVHIRFQDLVFPDGVSGLDKVRGVGVMLRDQAGDVLLDRDTERFLQGAQLAELRMEPTTLATAFYDALDGTQAPELRNLPESSPPEPPNVTAPGYKPPASPESPPARKQPPEPSRIGQFTARSGKRFFRIYVYPKEILFIHVKKDGPELTEIALGKFFGGVGKAVGSLLSDLQAERALIEMYRLHKDHLSRRQLLRDHPGSIRAWVDDIEDPSLEPPTTIQSVHWVFSYRAEKFKMEFRQGEEAVAAFEALRQVFSSRLQIHVAFDPASRKFRKRAKRP
jgi:hypothetical protein